MQIFSTFDEVEPIWRGLETKSEGYVFQTFDWVHEWYRHVGRELGIEPHIVVVGDADAPTMLLPLGVQRRRGLRILRWLGGDLCDYMGPLVASDAVGFQDRERFRSVWRAILAALPKVDVIQLESMPARVGAQLSPLRHLPWMRSESRAHFTELVGPWEEFYSNKRSARSRSTDRRKTRHLRKLGEVSIECPVAREDLPEVLDALARQKSRAYRELGVEDLLSSGGIRAFLEKMAYAHGPVAPVHVAALRIDGEIAAVHWGLVHDGRFYYMLPAYDDGSAMRFSPGDVLLRALLEWCIEHQIDTFDFTVGEESYKDHWCDQAMELHEYFAGRSWKGVGPALWARSRLRVRRTLKRSESLHRLVVAWRRGGLRAFYR